MEEHGPKTYKSLILLVINNLPEVSFSLPVNLKKKILQLNTLCFLTFLLIAGSGYGQSEKVKIDIEKLYKSRLEEHLSPKIDTLIAKEIVLFFAKPSFSPEYSMRIIERGNQTFIEARFLEKNLWYELFEHYKRQDEKSFFINVSLCSKLISHNFKERMLATFKSVIHNKKINDENTVSVDGISYSFLIFDKSEKVRSVEVNTPDSGAIEDNMVNLFTQMINDLKSESFDETKYIDYLN